MAGLLEPQGEFFEDVDGRDTLDYYTPTLDDYLRTVPRAWYPKFSSVTQPMVKISYTKEVEEFLKDPHTTIPSKYLSRSEESDDDADTESWGSFPSRPSTPPGAFLRLIQTQRHTRADEETALSDGEARSDNFAANAQDDSNNITLFGLDMMIIVMQKAIDELGGAVLPKMQWKAPRDARWIALNKSLKCQSPGDVLLLLKHSSVIDDTMEKAFEIASKGPQNYSFACDGISLFKWDDGFTPEFEFRCFVYNKKLVLISQRDASQAYASIVHDREGIIQDIHSFFRNHIFDKFPLPHYIFDVIRTLNRVILLDFNVFGLETVPSLTTYKELKHLIKETEYMSKEGQNTGLVNPPKYGEPYFRYATETVIGQANPDLQCPLPVEVATWGLALNHGLAQRSM